MRALAAVALALAAACSPASSEDIHPTPTTDAGQPGHPPPLLLLPRADAPDRFALALAAPGDAPAAATALPPLDTCVLRGAGEQREVVPQVEQDGVVVHARPGTALLVLATAAVDADGAPMPSVRSCKAIAAAAPGAVTAAAGLPLEIVPLIDPTALRPGAELPVRVLADGRGLGDALVRIAAAAADHLAQPAAFFTVATDASGTATLSVQDAPLHVLWVEVEVPVGDGAHRQPRSSTLTFTTHGGKR